MLCVFTVVAREGLFQYLKGYISDLYHHRITKLR